MKPLFTATYVNTWHNRQEQVSFLAEDIEDAHRIWNSYRFPPEYPGQLIEIRQDWPVADKK